MSSTYAGNDTFPANLTIPSDGDGPPKVADVNVSFEGLADRTIYLKNKVIEYSSIPSHTTVSPVFTWNSFTQTDLGVHIDVPSCAVGDVLDIEFTATELHHAPAGSDYATLLIRVTEQYGGGSPTDYELSSRIAMSPTAGNTWAFGATMRGRRTIAAAGTARVSISGQVNGTLVLWNGYAWVVRRIRP